MLNEEPDKAILTYICTVLSVQCYIIIDNVHFKYTQYSKWEDCKLLYVVAKKYIYVS